MNERVLISGASIAGLTLAALLARHGFRPTVVERAPALRSGGNGVDVRGRAREVAGRLGIRAAVEAAATDVRGITFVDDLGRATARVDIRTPDAVEIMRGDLVSLLHGAGRDGVEYLFGDTVTALRQDRGGVEAAFAHAAPRRFDLVVGADGLHSATRRLAFGPDERFLRFKDHYFAFADADPALGEDRRVTMHNRPGRMAGLYRSGTHRGAKAYFVFRSAPRALDHRDTERPRQLLREVFGGDGSWRIPELLDGALADPELYVDALAQVRMPDWSQGRIALTGDAAWCASPASGAGAELALTGAYRLAEALAADRGDHRTAFARYRAGHAPLVRRRQRIGPNIRLMVPRTALGRRVRDAAARLPLPRSQAAGPAGPNGRRSEGESGA